MQVKKLMQLYGVTFFGSYLLFFILLVVFYPRFQFPTFPGDILIGESFYLPLSSSLAFAFFVTIIFEIYKATK